MASTHLLIAPGSLAPFALSLTVGAYLVGSLLQSRIPGPLANPVLIAITIIASALRLLHVSYESYFAGAQWIHFLLGPATVALAIPLVQSIEHVRRSFRPLLIALVAGSMVGMFSGYGLVRLLGGSQVIALSMLPKSLTTPIALGVSQDIGGIPSLTAVLAIASGILVAISIDPLLNWLRIQDPSARGLAAGTAGSGIGASQVIPQHSNSAAFAAIAIGANGFLTAVLAPLAAPLLKHW